MYLCVFNTVESPCSAMHQLPGLQKPMIWDPDLWNCKPGNWCIALHYSVYIFTTFSLLFVEGMSSKCNLNNMLNSLKSLLAVVSDAYPEIPAASLSFSLLPNSLSAHYTINSNGMLGLPPMVTLEFLKNYRRTDGLSIRPWPAFAELITSSED